jgi:hypothetical protein
MNNVGMTFNILIKEEEDIFIAHCLELDIVSTSQSLEDVEAEIMSLIKAQIEYAFENENLENLYHPAPPEVWKEYFGCTTAEIKEYILKKALPENISPIYPPIVTVKTCIISNRHCHA